MTAQRKFKLLPTGDDFASQVSAGCYYVDKTVFLKRVFADDGSAVLLFTRPRRFGKTMLMSMFQNFLMVNEKDVTDKSRIAELFDGTAIMEEREFAAAFMGEYPVVSFSLKSVEGGDFLSAYRKFAELIVKLARSFAFLNNSEKLSDGDKQTLLKLQDRDFMRDPDNSDYLTGSLDTLVNALYKHFDRQVIVLIDEYDVPLAKASKGGYHDKMVILISGFLNLLKNDLISSGKNAGPLKKVVMTGCLKVAKNSIFTGVNNLATNTVLSFNRSFSSIMGFSKEETVRMLDEYGLGGFKKLVRDNYDGYRFDDEEIFCPWDVVNFVKDNYPHVANGQEYKICADNYWIATTSTPQDMVKEYVGFLSRSDNCRMQDLIDGDSIEVTINDSMNYDDLKMRRSEDFWSVLLHTGYLTAVERIFKNDYRVRIPNLEIADSFKRKIMANFTDFVSGTDNRAQRLAAALLKGDVDRAAELIFEALQSYVSVRDFATRSRPENLYQGFLSGIFSNCGNGITDYRSNQEAGDGYADITFKDAQALSAVVIELKTSGSDAELIDDAKAALSQIEGMRYAEPFVRNPRIRTIWIYGLSFAGKLCQLEGKQLR